MADLPTYGIGITKGPDGKHYLSLDIYTQYTEHHFYIGDAGNYELNAKTIHDGIISAGQEAARMDSGLITMDGLDGRDLNAIVRAQRGKPGRSRRES